MLNMKQRPRIYYSEAQKAIMWDRWRRGESLHDIARRVCPIFSRDWATQPAESPGNDQILLDAPC